MKTMVFDLDGTLVDSIPDLLSALNRLLASRNLTPFTAPEAETFMGDGAKVLLDRAFGARGAAADAAALPDFIADYTAHAAERTRAYPGVAETLAALRAQGWQLAVCTNKPVVAARKVLASLGLAEFFVAVGGGDSYPVRKPDPGHLLAVLAEAGGDPAGAVMMGDQHHDIDAARAAGVRSVWVTWGYGRAVQGADAVAEKFTDILSLARSFEL